MGKYSRPSRTGKILQQLLRWALIAVAAVVCVMGTVPILKSVGMGSGVNTAAGQDVSVDVALMDRYDMYMNNQVSNALDGVLSIDKVYWLSDDDLIAPEPKKECFGVSNNPSELGWLLEDAQKILKGQDTLFSLDLPFFKSYKSDMVNYYLDETMFAVTWKQQFDEVVYTISEIKINHPSQFRRFLAGGTYGSPKRMKTTDMAISVNAVVASSGDFYSFRRYGTIVYDGVVRRMECKYADTCYIDDKGDLIMGYRGQFNNAQEAQQFVDDNNIRFSLAFGPVLIDDGVNVTTNSYAVGEIHGHYARAALCQMDELHYLLVTVNFEGEAKQLPTLKEFADHIEDFGVRDAYTLDGGQTAVITMNDRRINAVQFGYERMISDIIYFATAVPDGE